MTISYPINLPTDDPAASITIGMVDVVRASVSPYTLRGQYIDYNAQQWRLTVSIPPVGRDLGARWIAFLAALRGRVGTFQSLVPGHENPRGAASELVGAPRLNGAGQTGYVIDVDGMPSSTFEYLAEGDFIQIGTRLYTITKRVTTNSSGAAKFDIWPPVNGEHPDNRLIIVQQPRGVFRLESDERSIMVNKFDEYGLTFTAIEALD